jgi:hypothetical protein
MIAVVAQMPAPQPMLPLGAVVSSAMEECTNSLDQLPGFRSTTEAVETTQGEALITCRRSKSGEVSVTIRMVKRVGTTRYDDSTLTNQS